MTETDYDYQSTPKLYNFIQPISRAIRDSAHVSKTLIEYCKYTNYMIEGRYKNAADMKKQTGLDYKNLRIKITDHKHNTETDVVVASLLLDIIDTLETTFNTTEEVHIQLEDLVNQMHSILNKMLQEFPHNHIKTTHTEITMAACQI